MNGRPRPAKGHGVAVGEIRKYLNALSAHMMTLASPQLLSRRVKPSQWKLHAMHPVAAADTSTGDNIRRLMAELEYEGAKRTRESSRTEFERVMSDVWPDDFQQAIDVLAASDPRWRGWVDVGAALLAYRIQVAPVLATTRPEITPALLKTQLAQLLYDEERRKRRRIKADFPATSRLYDGFTTWAYEHEKEVCVEDQPHKLRNVLTQILSQPKEGFHDAVLISKWRCIVGIPCQHSPSVGIPRPSAFPVRQHSPSVGISRWHSLSAFLVGTPHRHLITTARILGRLLEVVEAEIQREGEQSDLREIKQILDGHTRARTHARTCTHARACARAMCVCTDVFHQRTCSTRHWDDQSAASTEWFFYCPGLRAELRRFGYWRDAAVLQVSAIMRACQPQ